MNASVLYPVQTLEVHLTALEAAITVCLADPGGKPVHKLRTETRRVEALLLLLALVPGTPEHRKQAGTLHRSLARLRRAAGTVRDLDVHRKMLEGVAERKEDPTEEPTFPDVPQDAQLQPTKGQDPGRSRPRRRKQHAETSALANGSAPLDGDAPVAKVLGQAAAELRAHMGREREKAAAALQDLLKHRQVKTAKAAEALLAVLQPAQQLALPAADLLRDAEAVLTRDGLLQDKSPTTLSKEELHSVRKAAKAARYLAESLPEDEVLAEVARRFESLQELGGQWHDVLELARAARRRFGKGHELTAFYREQRQRALEAYRTALTARTQPAPPQPEPSSTRSAQAGSSQTSTPRRRQAA